MDKRLIHTLRRLPGYPRFEGKTPLEVIYEWLAESGYAEHKIYEILGPRGYLHVASRVALAPTDEAVELIADGIATTLVEELGYEEDSEPN